MKNCQFYILQTDSEIVEYEKVMYYAFKEKASYGWVVKNYQIINHCRLRSKNIKLHDQKFYVVKDNDLIIMGAAVNFNVNKPFQAEEMGFTLPVKNDTVCEGLIFFTNDQYIQGDNFVLLGTGLFEFIRSDLIKMKKKIVYGTCERKLKSMYSLLGYTVIDRKQVGHEKKLLMEMII